jgi:hypothetical protein
MLQKSETLARWIVRDLAIYARGRTMQWVPVSTITRRLTLRDEARVSKALERARANGWLEVEGGHSICLPVQDRKPAKPDLDPRGVADSPHNG